MCNVGYVVGHMNIYFQAFAYGRLKDHQVMSEQQARQHPHLRREQPLHIVSLPLVMSLSWPDTVYDRQPLVLMTYAMPITVYRHNEFVAIH